MAHIILPHDIKEKYLIGTPLNLLDLVSKILYKYYLETPNEPESTK